MGVVRGSSASRRVRTFASPKLHKIPIAWNATDLHTPSAAYLDFFATQPQKAGNGINKDKIVVTEDWLLTLLVAVN